MEVFKVFQDKEAFYKQIDNEKSNKLMYRQVLIICLFGFLYGIVMGSYHGFLQAIVAGLKVVVLFITTVGICFPSFFIIQYILGSKMSLRQMLFIIVSGFLLTSSITLSFSPIIVFFLITGNNYHFLQLLHVSIFMFSGIFGMKTILDSLKYACEKKSIYPQIGVTVFKVWIVILAFVGIQLSWNLRPFLGDRNEGFKLFRKYEGNFYTAIVYSFEQLLTKSDIEDNRETKFKLDTIQNKPVDSIDLILLTE